MALRHLRHHTHRKLRHQAATALANPIELVATPTTPRTNQITDNSPTARGARIRLGNLHRIRQVPHTDIRPSHRVCTAAMTGCCTSQEIAPTRTETLMVSGIASAIETVRTGTRHSS